MARIDTSQLRSWQNGDILPAQDYNQERNLIIEANNDTNNKANQATLNAQNALGIVNSIQQTGVPAALGTVISRQTFITTENQTIITLPAPGYIPNTNRVAAYVDGQRIPILELDNTSVGIPTLTSGTQVTVEWFTEVPRIMDVERIEDAIMAAEIATDAAEIATDAAHDSVTSTTLIWKDPVTSVSQLATKYPNPAHGWTVPVRQGSRIYRFESGQWRERIDLSYDMVDILSDLVDLSPINGGMFGEADNLIPINGGTF